LKPSGDSVRWAIVAGLGALAILGTARLIEPAFNCNRWDNYEFYTPTICEAHSQILAGHLPHLNPHQHMGEPLHATMQCGGLYLPYTVSLLLLRMFGAGNGQFCAVAIAVHVVIAALGWFFLLQRLSVRAPLAALLGMAMAHSGTFILLTYVWIYMAGIIAWIPWILFGTVALLQGPLRKRDLVILIVALAEEAFVGQPQMTIYVWLFCGFFAILYACFVTRQPKRLLAWAGAAAIAAMLSALIILPSFMFLMATPRKNSFTLEQALDRSTAPSIVMDILLPVYCYFNEALPNLVSALLNQGSWVAPAILSVLAGIVYRRVKKQDQEIPVEEATLQRTFVICLVCAVVFFIFAIGKYGLILTLMHGIPVWSSFHWPFKFLPFVTVSLGLAGALGLELGMRRPLISKRVSIAIASALTLIALLLLWLNYSRLDKWTGGDIPLGWRTWSGAVAGMVGLGLLGVVPYIHARWTHWFLYGALPLSALTLVVLCHAAGGELLHPYTQPYGSVGAAEFGFEKGFRSIPLSDAPLLPVCKPDVKLQQYSHSQSASANGYDSATGGHADDLEYSWYLEGLPCNVFGVVRPGVSEQLLGSNLLRSYNVRYLIVAKIDKQLLASVRARGCYHQISELDDTLVFEDAFALPRSYFATHTKAYNLEAFRSGLLLNKMPPKTALVEGPIVESVFAEADVVAANFGNSSVDLKVNAPKGGFLVVSQAFSPGWSAYVDDVPAEVFRVNCTIMGVNVPPGTQHVEMRFFTPGLKTGAALAAAGALLLSITLIWMRRSARRVAAAG
jgi:hypothetical protein